MRHWTLAALLFAASTAAWADDSPLQFSAGQADQGKAVYQSTCAACHGSQLEGGPGGPPLNGPAFLRRWEAQPGDALPNFIKAKMPPTSPGSLGQPAVTNVFAYLLQTNGGKPGQADLPADTKQLAGLSLAKTLPPLPPAPKIKYSEVQGTTDMSLKPDKIAQAATDRANALIGKVRPVTDNMLQHPPEGDWINWRNTYDAHGFSQLKQINRETVGHLSLAWSFSLQPGKNEITPLVHDGVMFVASAGRLQAFEAATGQLIWQHYRPGAEGPVRNLAIYGDKIYLADSDTHVLALDIKTGNVVWDHAIAAPGDELSLSAGPLIAKGKVIQGVSNCHVAYAGGCFIVALDAETGNEAWRFYTIARPGTPGGDSWNGAPLDQRYGASVWDAGSYDPELDLVYFGVGQTYKTATLLQGGTGAPGSADGLYTDTTLALKPETGELVWHFQHFHRDVWDLDWAFERTLTTLTVDGAKRRTVTTAGKLGIFDTLDAATGKYLFSIDSGLQNLVKSIDPKTGDKIIDPKFTPEANVEKLVCTSAIGGRNYPATSFNPATGILYVPLNEACMNFEWTPGGPFDVRIPTRQRPDSDGNIGRIQAIDLASRKTLWTRRQRAPESSAMLATAGGVIFEGSRDRMFRALDDRTGKVLWQTPLDGAPDAFPITFSADGVQYVAITTGGGGPLDGGLATLAPEFATSSTGTTLWVFRLSKP